MQMRTAVLARKSRAIFKVGDDMRQDMLVLQTFQLLQRLWKESEEELLIPMTNYACVCTYGDGGVVEVVPHATALGDLQREAGTITGDWKRWL